VKTTAPTPNERDKLWPGTVFIDEYYFVKDNQGFLAR
jgi:hypothetical protein